MYDTAPIIAHPCRFQLIPANIVVVIVVKLHKIIIKLINTCHKIISFFLK